MSFDVSVAIRDLSFTYTGASDPLFSALSLHLPAGFTGVVGANGTGKSLRARDASTARTTHATANNAPIHRRLRSPNSSTIGIRRRSNCAGASPSSRTSAHAGRR